MPTSTAFPFAMKGLAMRNIDSTTVWMKAAEAADMPGELASSRTGARWSVQPLSEPYELIDHYADSQQHQQRHDDGGTHSVIILLGRRGRGFFTRCAVQRRSR